LGLGAGRYRHGTIALREIRKYQRNTALLIRKIALSASGEGGSASLKNDLRFQSNTVLALHCSAGGC
jgi:histone H3